MNTESEKTVSGMMKTPVSGSRGPVELNFRFENAGLRRLFLFCADLLFVLWNPIGEEKEALA